MKSHPSIRTLSLLTVWGGRSASHPLSYRFLFNSGLFLKVSCCLGLSLSTLVVSAKDVATDESFTRFSSATSSSSSLSLSQEQLAQMYGLDMKQWSEYQTLLKGPRGLWSPNIHPLMALGMRKGIKEPERRRLARQYATIHFERVKRELAFEHAVFEAGMKKYGHLPLFREDFSQTKKSKSLNKSNKAVSRFQYFVRPDCASCKPTIQTWLKKGQKFDLYVSGNKQQITQFAKKMGISPLLVPRQITLNSMSKKEMHSLGIKALPFIKHSKGIKR